MPWTDIDGEGRSLEQIRAYIEGLRFTTWRPSGMVLHNTGAPNIFQWKQGSGPQRMRNLENYYKNQQKWSAGPHMFIDDDPETPFWVFTPFFKKGVHSPSFNGTRLGIEMVGNFDVDMIDSGRGRVIYNNTVALFALMHARMGWDPDTIKLHKEDPKTTHDCPGAHIDKATFIDDVKDYMGEGGGHSAEFDEAKPPPSPTWRSGVVQVSANDTLNVREGASMSTRKVDELKRGTRVEIIREAKNAATTWMEVRYKVDSEKGEAVRTGWVSGRYIIT